MKKKILIILLCGIMVLGFTGCNSNTERDSNKEIAKNLEPIEIDGISMTIKDGTLTKTGVTIIIKDEKDSKTHVYGESFRIDKKENGKWIKPKETGKDCAFNLKAYYTGATGILEFKQNWECMYGELEKGTYRLVKDTFLEKDIPITEDDVKYFSVEFTI